MGYVIQYDSARLGRRFVASLKAIIPNLALVLGATPTSLYERQRVLVGADLLSQATEKGPESSVRLDAKSVATLVLSVMATDSLMNAAQRTAAITQLRRNNGECDLTGASILLTTFSELLDKPELLDRLISLKVSRIAQRASLRYKPLGISDFGAEAPDADSMQVTAVLTGKQIRWIQNAMLGPVLASLGKGRGDPIVRRARGDFLSPR
jgi:hypothetical protein